MPLTIDKLKVHAEAWLSSVGARLNVDERQLVRNFVTHVEGRQAIADAIETLQAAGYTISPPPTAQTPSADKA